MNALLKPPAYGIDWDGLWKKLFDKAGKPYKPSTRYQLESGRNLEIVYDWRLGIPQLMSMISMRIQVMAAYDPQFRERPGEFAPELIEYKDKLEQHFRKMAEGVQCTSFDDYDDLYIGCADIYSGENVLRRIPLWKYRPVTVNVPLLTENMEAELRPIVMNSMPFGEMQAMINTLNLLAFNSPGTADGTLMREASRPEVYIVHGGAKFFLLSWDEFNAMGLDANAIQVVEDGSMMKFGIVPRDGTLLKELSRPEVYVFRGGNKVHVPNEDEFNRAGLDWNAIRIVPDGSTSWMPTSLWDWSRN